MCNFKIFATIAIFVFSAENANAKSYQDLSRHRRTSDQRLAELETLFALSKMNGKLVTVPIGFGKVDFNKLGRRKRSNNLLLQQLNSDLTSKENSSNKIYKEDKYKKEKEETVSKNEKSLNYFVKDKLEVLSHPHLPVKLPK